MADQVACRIGGSGRVAELTVDRAPCISCMTPCHGNLAIGLCLARASSLPLIRLHRRSHAVASMVRAACLAVRCSQGAEVASIPPHAPSPSFATHTGLVPTVPAQNPITTSRRAGKAQDGNAHLTSSEVGMASRHLATHPCPAANTSGRLALTLRCIWQTRNHARVSLAWSLGSSFSIHLSTCSACVADLALTVMPNIQRTLHQRTARLSFRLAQVR